MTKPAPACLLHLLMSRPLPLCDAERLRETHREREPDRDRQKNRERQTNREKQRDRKTARQERQRNTHTHTHSHSHSHTHTQCALFFRSGCWTTTTSCPSTAQPSLASTHFSPCEPLPPTHPIPKAQQPKPMCTRAFSMPILTRTMYPSLLTPRTVLWPRTASQRWSFFSRRRCSCFNHCECPVLKKGEQRQPCMCMCDGEKSGLLA